MAKRLLAATCLLLTVLNGTSSQLQVRDRLFSKDDDARGFTFETDVIYEKPQASSRLACGAACTRSESCITFTYVSGTSLCRLHSAIMTYDSAYTTSLGANTYFVVDRTDWLETPCTSSADCLALNSECFKGKCLCTPGYYYSHKRNYCIPECRPENLQGLFLSYQVSAIDGFNLVEQGGKTAQECLDWCVSYGSVCLSADYTNDGGFCYIQTVDANDVGDAWDPNYGGFTYNQKTCS